MTRTVGRSIAGLSWRTGLVYAVLFAAALGAYSTLWRGTPVIDGDSPQYQEVAKDLLDLRLDRLHYRTIGYPILLALTGAADHATAPLLVVSILLHLASVWMLAVVLRAAGVGPRWILAFGGLLLLPPFVEPAAWIMTENLSQFTLAAGLACLVLGLSPARYRLLGLSALAFGYAALTRPVYGALGALDAYMRKPGPKRLALVALAVGVALAAKYTALLLLPLALGVFLWVERRRHAGRGVAGWYRPAASACWQTVGVGAAALLLVWAMHGFAMTRILPDGWNPPPRLRNEAGAMMKAVSSAILVPAPVRGIVFQIEHASGGQQQFLLGQKSSRGWWYYYPLAWLFRSTPAELLLAALLPFLAWRARHGLDRTAALLAAGAALVAASLLASKLDLGVRYMLVIYPIVALLAIECAAVIGRQVRWMTALAAALVTLPAASAAAAAPQYLSYFNRVFTPPGQAHTRLVDSNLDWGQDLPALRAALSERGTNRVLLAYFGVAPPEAYGIEATPWDTPDGEAVARQRWIAISATLMNNVYLRGDPFRDFRRISADARPSEGLFVYDAARPEVRQALEYTRSRVALQPCRPGATAPKSTDSSWSVLSHWYIRCTGM